MGDSILPTMGYARPIVPDVPLRATALPHSLQESGRYEYLPPFLGEEVVKRPLIMPVSARSEGALSLSSRGRGFAQATEQALQGAASFNVDSTRVVGAGTIRQSSHEATGDVRRSRDWTCED